MNADLADHPPRRPSTAQTIHQERRRGAGGGEGAGGGREGGAGDAGVEGLDDVRVCVL